MNDKQKKPVIKQETIMELLNNTYDKCLSGVPHISPSIEEQANDYLKKYKDPAKACKVMMRNQIVKCTTSGFLAGFGGIITWPAAIPANIGSVIYVQMRMIACAAYMNGYDLDSDQARTLVYACLAGVSVNQFVKDAGVKFTLKFANGMVKKIPGEALVKINQKVGFRFITKFGETGIINLGKTVPVAGAVVGGGFDLVETKVIAKRALKWFMEGDFSVEGDEVIDEESQIDDDIDYIDFEIEE
jgi:hypothetical protein